MRLRKETSKRPVEQAGREPPPEFANLTFELLQPVQHSKRYAVTNVDSLGVIERFTFAEITRETARWAQLLREKGLQPGDRVLIVAGREWGWRCALLGTIHAGGVAVPCPPSLPLRELRTVAEHADASLLVSLRPPPELVELDGRSALTADDLETVEPAHALEQRPHRTDPRDIALILYAWHGLDLTGAMHTHASLLAQADAAEHWLGVDEDERIWATADDGSGPSIWLLLAAWRRAASIVVVDLELDSDAKLELLDRLRPAALWFSDDEYAILGSAAVPPWVDLRSIRRALVDSDETEGASSFATAFGAALVPVFALDELGVLAGWPAGREGHADAQTAQPPPGVHVAVVGEDGTELPPGEVGDVAVRGDAPTLFTGYAGKEGRSRSAGWFRFGWRGALTAEGALRVETRSPREVEPVDASSDLPVPEVTDEPLAADQQEAAEVDAQQAAAVEAREAEERQREIAAAQEAEEGRLLAEQEARERAAAEAEERGRAEQEAKKREKAEAEERHRAEERAKAQQEVAAAEAKQRAEEEKRSEKERQREEKEARARAEHEAKEREKAEAEERRRAEEEAKNQAKVAAAEATQRAKDDKEREKREAKDRVEREKAEAEAAKVQAKVDAAEAKQRAKDDKEREKREAKERVEREKAEAEAAKVQAKVDAAEAKQRAEEEKRREKEREQEEKEARHRAEQEAKEAERAERRAAREEKRRAPEAPKPADDGQRRFGRRRREVVEEPEPEHVPDVVARIQQYGMAAASSERPAEPPEQPDDE